MRQILIRPKDLISVSIALVVLLVFGLLVFNQWVNFSSTQRDLKEEKAILESLEAKKETLNKLKENEDRVIKELSSLQHMFSLDKGYVDIFNHLQSVFVEYDIQVIQIELADYVDKEGFSEIPIKISIKAQYVNIVNLLNDLKVGDKPFRVDNFYMDKADDINSVFYCDLLAYGFFKTTTK